MTILRDSVRCPEEAIHVLKILGGLLDREGVRWWLDYGSLLGHVRDGGMIPWDSDIDIGILGEDLQKVLSLAGELKRDHRFPTCYHPPGPALFRSGHWFHVTRASRNPNGVDVFPWYEEEGELYRIRYADCDKVKGRAFPVSRLLPLGRATWEGVAVSVPANPRWLAAHRYGAEWRTPVDYHETPPVVGTE